MEYYTEEATSSLNNVSDSATEMGYEEEGIDDFCRYRKE